MIIKDLRNYYQEVLEIFEVKASDRGYQIWERNALRVSLWSPPVFKQKVNDIHLNPVVSGICKFPEEYSSASFYLKADCKWSFLTYYKCVKICW